MSLTSTHFRDKEEICTIIPAPTVERIWIRARHVIANGNTRNKVDVAKKEGNMKTGVTKFELVGKLAELLRLTRLDIEDLELLDECTVIIHYDCGSTKAIDITADSGIAIIRDVCKHAIY